MILKMKNKLFSIQIFILLGWMSLWVSINSMPDELAYMYLDKITFFNGMRTIFAIIFSLSTISLACYFIFMSFVKKLCLDEMHERRTILKFK